MPIVEALTFADWEGRTRTIEFIHALEDLAVHRFQTTVITGQNGSNKSTMLKELVSALTVSEQSSRHIRLAGTSGIPSHVICCSGAVADRFPEKERGGRPTEFNVPSYSYLGQRVGKNLLSKKRPMETMLAFALDDSVRERFTWPFFSTAHQLAGVSETTTFELQFQKLKYDPGLLFNDLRELAGRADTTTRGNDKPPALSPSTAQWLLKNFDEATFSELRDGLHRVRRFEVSMSSEGPRCEQFSNRAIRLGLLTDTLTLVRADVTSIRSGGGFSAYDLSSGEYHMFTSILALGLGIKATSVVLVDEPENSLHPQWQKDFMDSVATVCERVLEEGHLIVCTHSPLIVAAAPVGSNVLDLSVDNPQVTRVHFGASSDELLLSQFGVGSSRNRIVVDAMQRAISLVERGGFKSDEFIGMLPELKEIRNALRDSDPLSDVIDELLGSEGSVV